MRNYLKRQMADKERLTRGWLLRPLAPWLLHPGLWSLNRRAVAGGVALGLICGVLPSPLQSIFAAIFAILLHINLPAALLATLYTNPLTFVPVYLFGLRIGLWIFEAVGAVPERMTDDGEVLVGFPPPPDFAWGQFWDSLIDLIGWMASLGWPLIVGLAVLGVVLALIGYALVWLIWGYAVFRSRQRRLSGRKLKVRSQRAASDASCVTTTKADS